MQGVWVGAGVGDLDRHQDVVGGGLGVVDLDHPVAVLVEGAGVEQLVLKVVFAAPAVLLAQVVVGESALGVVVAPAVPGVAREGVEVPPIVLHVLAVVGLGPGQAVGTLFEDRVPAVPQRQAQAQPLLDVRETGQAVLAPAVGPGAGMVVGKVRPGLSVGAVVLPDRPPLALAQVRAPEVPVARLAQPVLEFPKSLDPL